MSPRIIHIPLSCDDRKAQAKGIRHAHGLHNSQYRQPVQIRNAAEAKLRNADRLECEAWNAIMWAGGPAMPSPGEPQAEPTIAKADQRRLRPAGGGSAIAVTVSQPPTPTPSSVMKCLVCEDSGWVCENHPDQPWTGPHACDGAGAPCPRCNAATADEPPRLPKGFAPDDGA
jgi:hypothetical protein